MALNWELENGNTLEQTRVSQEWLFDICMIMEMVGISKITEESKQAILLRWEISSALSGNPLTDKYRQAYKDALTQLISLRINTVDRTHLDFLRSLPKRRHSILNIALPKGYVKWQGGIVK
jgi:hypothetical protein